MRCFLPHDTYINKRTKKTSWKKNSYYILYSALRVRRTVVVCSKQRRNEDRLGAFGAQIRWPPTHRPRYGRASRRPSSFQLYQPQKKPTRVAAGMLVRVCDTICIIYEIEFKKKLLSYTHHFFLVSFSYNRIYYVGTAVDFFLNKILNIYVSILIF